MKILQGSLPASASRQPQDETRRKDMPWRLFIVGANAFAANLAKFAQTLDYHVTVCEPRLEFAEQWTGSPVTMTARMPADAVAQFAPDTRSAVVAISDDPNLDAMALRAALMSPAFYVAAVSPGASMHEKTDRAASDGEKVGRIRHSAGLTLGGTTIPERCLAIVAEITAARYGIAMNSCVTVPNPSLASHGPS
jgi:xanthine dehydrogenase accessory factor